VDYRQEGGLSAVGISYALQATPKLSFGLTMNIWDEGLGNTWKQKTSYTAEGVLGSFVLHEKYNNFDKYSFSGINCNVGMLWRVTGALTFGLVYKTPFTADIQHHTSLEQTILVKDTTQPPLFVISTQNTFDEELEMPASYGMGIAYRFSDHLTTSFDIYRTEWGDMIYEDYLGNRTSAISGVKEEKSDIDATVQARAGIEYLIIRSSYLIPLRAGIFYDPAPSEKSSDEFYGFSLGSGFAMDKYIFDVGYQFRFGRGVGAAIFKSGELSQDVQEHSLYCSLILHF
jgi:long-subunit fatty acid transport protein